MLAGLVYIAIISLAIALLGYAYKMDTKKAKTKGGNAGQTANATAAQATAHGATATQNAAHPVGGHGGGTSAPANIADKISFTTLAILLVSYLLVLRGFAIIWPTAWQAWSGEGFWLSQVLFIAMIVILSFVKPAKLRGFAWIPGVMALLLVVFTMVKNWPSIEKDMPASYSEEIILSKAGDQVSKKVPIDYKFNFSNPGNKYYYQSKNQPKPELWGDGKYHDAGENVTEFTVSFAEKPVTIICYFKKLP